ncbi:MAG: ATP-binding cassette domain-containing protein, partial [Caulobacteraceae bacterium]
IQRYRKALREATAEVTGFIGETFGAVQAVKLAGAEARMAARFERLGLARRSAAIRDLMLTTGLTAFSANMAVIAAGFVLLLAAQAMRVGRFTVGDFTLFVNYLALVSAAPSIVGQLLATERQAKVSIDRMNAFAHGAAPMAMAARPRAGMTPPASALPRSDALKVFEARGLTCLHAGSGRGVRDIDLKVERGRFLAVTGPVGSGKTTLVRALLGLCGRDAGDVFWNGQAVADPSLFFVPPRCAYTAQTPRLFSETLRENLLMGEPDDPARLAAAIELAVFDEDVAAFDAGLETPVGARGVTLSGGQAQRAAAARMFVRAPDLLIFDDLSSALDVATERKLWRRLFASGERTCIAVSHR